MHMFTTKSISVSNTKRMKLVQLQLSVNTQCVPLMHIVAKSKSISSENINYETHIYLHGGAAGARNVLESAGFV